MFQFRSLTLPRALALLTVLVILKTAFAVVLNYGDYFPPNFRADFLRGRESHFFGAYGAAFYLHIIIGPPALLLGLLLLSERFRVGFPRWHRRLGRVQAPAVLLLLAPSGLWIAQHAQAGPVAGAGFALLAVVTGICVALGWKAAVKRQFVAHRLWMSRCYVLMCSAVVIRVIGGLATVLEVQNAWIDPLAAWASWIVPLTAYELHRATRRRQSRVAENAVGARRQSASSVSLPAIEIIARR